MNSTFTEENMLCNFEWRPCVHTLQLPWRDLLEMPGVGRGYVEALLVSTEGRLAICRAGVSPLWGWHKNYSCFLCARHYAKCFIFKSSFNLCNSPMTSVVVLLLPLATKWSWVWLTQLWRARALTRGCHILSWHSTLLWYIGNLMKHVALTMSQMGKMCTTSFFLFP